MAKVSAIVLAAGLSRRMGEENKLFLPVNDRPMVEWVIEKVAQSTADEVIIVGSELSLDRFEKWKSDRVQVINNPHYQNGMTSSIQAGVQVASGDGYMICLGDQPKIEISTYNELIAAFQSSFAQNEGSIVLPFYDGKKGNPVIFSAIYREDILNHTEPEGCKEIVQANKHHLTKVDVSDSGILMDVDTREDYERLT